MNKYIVITLFLTCIFLSCKNDSFDQDKITANKLYIQSLEAYSKKDFNLAIKLAEKALTLHKDLIQGSLLIAKSYFFLGKNSEAIESLSKLINKHPEFTDARIWNIRILILTENYQQAKNYLENELLINQTDWRVYYLYSLLAKAERNYEIQLSMLEKAEIALSDGAKVFGEISSVWHGLGLVNKAEENTNKQKILLGE